MITGSLWERLRVRWRALIGFALVFQALESLLLAPVLGVAGHALVGLPVVDSTGLVAFALSPRGMLSILLGASAVLTIRLLGQAGLSLIALGALEGRPIGALEAMRFVFRELPRLVRLGVRVVGWILAVVAPLVAVTGLGVARLLTRHDINYYLAERPPEFVTAGAIIGGVALATLAVGAWLFVRWRLVVQTCLFDRREGAAAFRESAALVAGKWWRLAGAGAGVLLGQIALALAATWLSQRTVALVLGLGGRTMTSLVVSFSVLMALRTVTGALVTCLGSCLEAVVFTWLHWQHRRRLRGEVSWRQLEAETRQLAPIPGLARPLAYGIACGLCVLGGSSAVLAVNALGQERPVLVTAHRGGTRKAPENTVAAIREAIADGAHFAEIDVQMARDGVLVVIHDSDFARVGGVAMKVWDLTYDEIRKVPVGLHAAPEFRNETVPTLAEVLAVAKGAIRLNLELKYYGDHQPGLARRVVEEVRAHDMLREVIVQCLEYGPLQEVRGLAPEVPVGYLFSVNARQPKQLKVSFLSAGLGRITGAFVAAAHRRGQEVHVWTVDAPADIERMIDLGVDNLITNQAGQALELIRAYEQLPRTERVLRRIRGWLSH